MACDHSLLALLLRLIFGPLLIADAGGFGQTHVEDVVVEEEFVA
jgi:hypothetical protein